MTKPTVRQRLEGMALSQTDFAALCHVSKGTVNAWCQGYRETPGYAVTILDLIDAVQSPVKQAKQMILRNRSRMVKQDQR